MKVKLYYYKKQKKNGFSDRLEQSDVHPISLNQQ